MCWACVAFVEMLISRCIVNVINVRLSSAISSYHCYQCFHCNVIHGTNEKLRFGTPKLIWGTRPCCHPAHPSANKICSFANIGFSKVVLAICEEIIKGNLHRPNFIKRKLEKNAICENTLCKKKQLFQTSPRRTT